MHRVHAAPSSALAGLVVLLGGLAVTVGLGPVAWSVGLACGVGLLGLLVAAMGRHERPGLMPADRVTLARGLLATAVAALVAEAATGHDAAHLRITLVALAAIALVLDGVDGPVARRTGTASDFGARFDMEVDAFLILVLSVHVARTSGWWVLGIGLARYAFVAATWVWPWLRASLPRRSWARVVAAVQGVVLAVAAADVLPDRVTLAALVVAAALLAESFGRQVHDLRRLALRPPASGRVVTGVAFVVVWAALVLPDTVDLLTPAGLLRVPLEGLVVVVVALLLPDVVRRPVAVVAGLALAALVVLRLLDMGFRVVFDRPFDVLNDWYYLGPGIGVLRDSIGGSAALAVTVGAGVLLVALAVGLPVSTLRVAGWVHRHRRGSARAVVALGIAWALLAVAGVQLASTSAARQAVDAVAQVRADLADRRTFAREIGSDSFATEPDGMLAGLRGKDVLLVFVESYGRVAVQDTTYAPGVDAVLDAGTRRLRSAGFSARSAFLTSPTFGAGSWLAHASLQSGLWVDSQQRYDQLMTSDRLTLSDAFRRAGWRTVSDVPADTHAWAQGQAFYHFDQMYDSRDVGYRGPTFGYASMPDQYTLAALRRLELTGAGRRPVMAEVDLVSSHHPWTPLPRMLPWARVGDGSVYAGMPEQGPSADVLFRDPERVRAAYGRSIEYSLRALVSFVATHPDPDLVLVVLGDHQPHSYVTGADPGRDVPVSIVAHDPAVLDRIADWGWQDGLRPSPTAPVWRMDAFRDRFLTAYGR
ncbi:CDP-alcohol phosphatidyltransferase family protein [Nocardioides sp. LS1]|uniref:CDP-alcohol phosphatidyltransferase family protein n=1 Tax=Nocardioides sp. LS1 TaxID=1027620 RepID=UPI000F6271EF|nr:CDP-alcohol phosphatidyltransferase family protein [Nocardioides sp. LS1]